MKFNYLVEKKRKKEYFIYNGRKYRAPWLIVKIAPFVIVAGQMGLVIVSVIGLLLVVYGLM